jgi:membrane-associated protein
MIVGRLAPSDLCRIDNFVYLYNTVFMDLMLQFADVILHIDKYLGVLIQTYGTVTYLILFTIVFCETGLVVTPFLPGDSLLFAAGTFAAIGALNVYALFAVLVAAAIIGDNTNYWIGYHIGPKVFSRENVRFLNKKHIEKTHQFYEKYGTKTIIMARFIPIIRTFSPFVAGLGSMEYSRFLPFDILGGILWVGICVFSGFFFGNIPIVRQNFSIVIFAIIFISILPAAIQLVKSKTKM